MELESELWAWIKEIFKRMENSILTRMYSKSSSAFGTTYL